MSLADRQSRVDADRRAGDVASVVGEQEDDRAGAVLRIADAPQRNAFEPRGYDDGSFSASRFLSVAVSPGATALTRMPCLPSSTTIERVSASTPDFAAV